LIKLKSNCVSQAVQDIGASVEGILIKFGKNIVEEQYYLNRLAEATIDAYSMVVILSRASRSLEKNLPSAQHEATMVKVWCNEVWYMFSSEIRYQLKFHPQSTFHNF
jgi:very long chain acyl-CoA dehydrogenase